MATELAQAYVQIIPSMKDIKSNITSELDGIVTSAENVETALTSVGASAGDAGIDLDALGDNVGSAGEELTGLEGNVTGLDGELDSLGNSAGSAGDGFGDLSSDAGSAGGSLDSLAGSAGLAEGDIDSLTDAAGNAADSLGELSSISIDLDVDSSGLDDISGAAGDAADALDDLSDAAEDIDFSSIDEASDSVSGLGDAAGGAIGDVGDLGLELGETMVSGSSDAADAFNLFSDVTQAFVTGGIAAGVIAAVEGIVEEIWDMVDAAQQAEAIIAQGTGATGEQLEEFRDLAKDALKEVSIATETDLDTMSAVLAETNTRFDYTGEQLKDMSVSMTDFAAITGQDAVQAVDKIANVTNTWGLSAGEIPGVLDEITVASQNSAISADELESSLSNNAMWFDALGMSVDDAIAFIAAYADVNDDASSLTRGLRSAVTNLNGEVDDVPGTFQQAMDVIQSSDGTIEALNSEIGDTGMTIEDVFGSMSAGKFVNNVQSEAFALDDMTAALGESSGAFAQTTEDSVTFKDNLQGSMNSAKVAMMDFPDTVESSFGAATETMGSMGEAMGYSLANYTDVMYDTGEGLGEAAASGVEEAEPLMEEAGNEHGTAYAEGLEGMSDEVGGALDSTMTEMIDFGSEAEIELSTSAAEAAASVGEGYSQLESNVGSALDESMSEMVDWESQTTSTASSAAQGIVSEVGSGLSSLESTVDAPLSAALSNEESWGNDSKASATETATTFVTNTQNGMSSIGDTVSTQLAKATSQVESWQTMMNTKSTAIGTTFLNNIVNAISPLASRVASALSAALSTASSYVGSFGSTGTSIGSNLIQGMINGINSRSGALYSTISSVVNSAVSAANAAAGTHSPSTKLAWTGRMMDEGLALGLSEYSGVVDDAMDDVMGIVDKTASMNYAVSGSASGTSESMKDLLGILEYYLPMLANMQIVMDSGETVGALGNKMTAFVENKISKNTLSYQRARGV